MARRRLSDLMREEANKPSEDATTAAGGKPSAEEPEANPLDAAGKTAAIVADAAPTKATTAAKSRATKQTEATEPEAMTEPKQDDTLLQKIADLTTALEAQTKTIEHLQSELEQTHTLKAELEQTRKDVRQLADSNAKLTQELQTLQTQKSVPSTLTTKDTPPSYQELRLSSPPIAPTSNPPNSFNKDVGWFD